MITVSDPAEQPSPSLAAAKNELYAAAVRRHGGSPLLLNPSAGDAERDAALATMDGLVLAGGADLHPSRYGQGDTGTRHPEPHRDALEAESWAMAAAHDRPVLGICRGLQAINVFSGGTLLQHVDAHAGPAYGHGPALQHPIRLVAGSRLARILDAAAVPAAEAPVELTVNSYHHQAVRPGDLATGLRPAALADSPAGPLVEAFEAPDRRFVLAVQCHPERTESSPPELERLWAEFVSACRA